MADILDIAPTEGLPPILFGVVPDAPVALVSDALSALAAFGPQPWGIYQDGAPVIVADTVVDLGYSKSYTISDYPIEGGSFASYDKVEAPFEARVRFVSGGSPAVRDALLSSVTAIIGDFDLYDVVTPDAVYPSANLVRMEYRRSNQEGGGSLLSVDVGVQEVRILSGDTSASPSDPASADQQNGGTVQGQDNASPSYPVTASVSAGTASETAASAQTGAGAGYSTAPLPPERPATLFDSTGAGGRTI